MYKVIDFFKSYTIELDKMSLYYVILGDQKPEIRLITEIHSEKMIKDITTINGTYSDTICTEKTIIISDNINGKTDTTRYYYNKNTYKEDWLMQTKLLEDYILARDEKKNIRTELYKVDKKYIWRASINFYWFKWFITRWKILYIAKMG